MKKKVIETNDFLFFYQLVLTFCNTEKSGMNQDKRLSYYDQVGDTGHKRRTRGYNENKWTLGIEMNAPREIYLST